MLQATASKTERTKRIAFDPLSPATLADPYPFYAALRDRAPVFDAPGGYALVSRYEDVRTAALDTSTYSSKLVSLLVGGRGTGLIEPLVKLGGPVDTLAITDAPVHLAQRKLVTKHMGRDVVADLEARVVRPEVERAVCALLAAGAGDVVRMLGAPLPVVVTLELLGLPRADLPKVKSWSDESVRLLSGVISKLGFTYGAMRMIAFQTYASRAVARAVRDRMSNALLGALVEASREGVLDDREAASIVMQLLIAGSDSTANLIASGVRFLAADPALAATLRAAPERIPAFVEEVLRLETPFQGHFRVVTRDTTLAGTELRAGQRLMLLWASANRDDRVYREPERIDLDRKGPAHFGFGHGAHLCLGAALARMQARVVFETLLARARTLELRDTHTRYVPSVFTRTVVELPVRLAR